MTKARDLAQAPNQSFSFKNRIINGGMVFDQRNNGAAVTNANAYIIDRWADFKVGSGAYTAQRSTLAPAGFTNSFQHTVTTAVSPAAGDVYQVYQGIEGFNIADLGFGTSSAQPVTVSFWVRSSVTGLYAASLRNSAGSRSYVFTYTINAANTWEYKTATINGDTTGTWLTDNGAGIILVFDLGSGSNQNTTAGTWQSGDFRRTSACVNWISTNGATFYITGVQLEKGSTATSFDYRPYGTELALCQRYFQKTCGFFAATQVGNELNCVGSYAQWVPLRADPTVTIPSGATFHRPGIAFYAVSAVSGGQNANGIGYTTCTIASGAGAGTVGQLNNGFNLSAEL